nr:replication factor C large subunit [Candidatus Njordarchaeota archaeon]
MNALLPMRVSGNNAVWADKYSPRKTSEVLGNNEAVSKIAKWLSAWKGGKAPEKKAILLSGPTGTGKTAMVYAISNELGYEVVEVNASDKRDRETVRRIVGGYALQGSLLGDIRGRVLLIDEVDGLSGDEDRGGVSAMIETIEETVNPIILTANDKWDPKIRSLQSHCMILDIRRIQTGTIVNALTKICHKEGIKANPEAFRVIAENSNGDLRSAINDLQAVAEGKTELSLEDVKALRTMRDRAKGIFDGLRGMFQASSLSIARASLESLDMDHDMLIQWIYENIPREFDNPSELAQGFNALSRADMFLGRIKKHQDWGLLSYVYDLMSGGVSLARQIPSKRFVSYSFPNYIRALSASRSRRNAFKVICSKIAARCHASTREVFQEYLPMIEMVIENDAKTGTDMIRKFELTEDDLDVITGGKKIRKIEKEAPRSTEPKKVKTKPRTEETKQALLF